MSNSIKFRLPNDDQGFRRYRPGVLVESRHTANGLVGSIVVFTKTTDKDLVDVDGEPIFPDATSGVQPMDGVHHGTLIGQWEEA